jgi:hypothetical protein
VEYLPNYGLANTATSFATLGAGIMPLVLSYLMLRQPARWMFVYWMIVVTGVFTVTLHGYGETNPIWGERWFWAFLDTGSNIVVSWSIALAILGDYYTKATRRWAAPAVTVAMLVGVAWHYYDRMPSTPRQYLLDFGGWGGFNPGEAWLIGFSWLTVGLFVAKLKLIPREAKPLLAFTFGIFFFGMLLATASNDKILYPFYSLHALWHIVGAFGFIAFWAFNHVRFTIEAQREGVKA